MEICHPVDNRITPVWDSSKMANIIHFRVYFDSTFINKLLEDLGWKMAA